MDRLVLTGSRSRMVNGETRYSCLSRFVDEIPKEVMKEERLEPRLGRKISRDEFADDSLPWNQAQTRLGFSSLRRNFPNAYFDKPSVEGELSGRK